MVGHARTNKNYVVETPAECVGGPFTHPLRSVWTRVLYEDDTPCETFLRMANEGSTVSGLGCCDHAWSYRRSPVVPTSKLSAGAFINHE